MNHVFINQALKTIGWPIEEQELTTSSYRVSSRCGERRVRVSAYGAGFLDPPMPGEGARLAFVIIEVGLVEGESTSWGLLSVRALDVQVVGAPGWLVLAAGFVLSSIPISDELKKLEALFELARVLTDTDGVASDGSCRWRDWPYDVLDNPLVKRRTLPLKIGGSVATVTSAASMAASIALLGEASILLLYPIGFLGLSGVLSMATGFQRTAAIYRSHAQAKPALKALRSSRTFDVRPKVTPQRQAWFNVMGVANEQLSLAQASHQSALISSGSKALGLTLRLTLHTTYFPVQTVDRSRLLPSSWCTLELHGPSEQISQVPTRRQEDRTNELVRWQMDPEELEQGELVNWLLMVDATFHKPPVGPYR